jgi:purine-nucleoside/S-methyl-5'-thioadenosine phosphorylase / adenosine deaminase
MLYHTEGLFQIAFGDARAAFDPLDYKKTESGHVLLDQKPFDHIKQSMHIDQLIFLHQVHGNQGLIITGREQVGHLMPFSHEGDFLCTNLPGIGLAVATADCLPIVLYSSSLFPCVAVAHAGWRGSVQSVAVEALEQFKRSFGVDEKSIRVFLGPSAKRCCYSVGDEVEDALDSFYYKDDVLHRLAGQTFFDLPRFNQLQLQEAGLSKEAFTLSYNYCTMCDPAFCSYRRQHSSARNMTVVALR